MSFPQYGCGPIVLENGVAGGNPGLDNSNEKDALCASAIVPEPADLKAAS